MNETDMIKPMLAEQDFRAATIMFGVISYIAQ
jgi:hypothetical protein